MDAGVEAIGTGPERAQVRRQGRALQYQALSTALVLTLLALLV